MNTDQAYEATGALDGPEPWMEAGSARKAVPNSFKFNAGSADPQDHLSTGDLTRGYLDPVEEDELGSTEVDYPDFMNRPNPAW